MLTFKSIFDHDFGRKMSREEAHTSAFIKRLTRVIVHLVFGGFIPFSCSDFPSEFAFLLKPLKFLSIYIEKFAN